MDMLNVITVIISILSSSIFTLILSSFIIEPMREKKRYIFNEKKRLYISLIIFAQIVLYPKEAKYSLSVKLYNIQELPDEENVKNALNDLCMAIPRLRLITKNQRIIEVTESFVEKKDEETFNCLVNLLQKDLYK
ncbi:hypothetical protein E8P77_22340 [Soehngenia saccharolytica]|jgi:hypothetical protein|nr:hypothetical protein E8P77_22340 [Soehngenia saccharolytica]